MKKTFSCGRTCGYKQLCKFAPIISHLGPTRVFSHITRVNVVVKDLDALEAAGKICGLKLNRNQTTYKWFGQSVGDYPVPEGINVKDLGHCTHALSLADKSAYEIGVVEQADGTFRLIWDFWNGGYGLQAAVGTDAKLLIEAYTIEAARVAAVSQGWMTLDQQDGSLLILHPEGGTLTIARDGTVDAQGFIGQGCCAGSIIENALGIAKETTYKAEYYAQTVKVEL